MESGDNLKIDDLKAPRKWGSLRGSGREKRDSEYTEGVEVLSEFPAFSSLSNILYCI